MVRSLFVFITCFALTTSASMKPIVNDITKLNPIAVRRIIIPTTTEEIVSALKSSKGPVSIGGGRYSMGGQTATEDAVQIDMRSFNKVLKLDVKNKKITVQAGITWRDILDAIDKHDLSVKIMQSYSNFTVGGSLSVNAHGRYIGQGPLIRSVDSIKVVLANGEEVVASPFQNTDIFFAAIGGYGGIGVITEATLNLTSNEKVRREIQVIPTVDYKKTFFAKIRDSNDVVFHNGDIYPPDFNQVSMETWLRTDKDLTIADRLIPRGKTYWLEPNVISSLSIIPFGAEIRRNFLDPLLHSKEVVVWRNHEASYDVALLEPITPRIFWTYVLQEYFIPVSKFEEFVPKMREVFKKNNVNVINVSIRHAMPDTGSFLAWAPEEVFSFVVYYKQGTSSYAKQSVAKWTREMIGAALSVNGRYYLPYQIHASQEQFEKAYPGFKKYAEVKKKYDPTYRFKNKLWDKYYK